MGKKPSRLRKDGQSLASPKLSTRASQRGSSPWCVTETGLGEAAAADSEFSDGHRTLSAAAILEQAGESV